MQVEFDMRAKGVTSATCRVMCKGGRSVRWGWGSLHIATPGARGTKSTHWNDPDSPEQHREQFGQLTKHQVPEWPCIHWVREVGADSIKLQQNGNLHASATDWLGGPAYKWEPGQRGKSVVAMLLLATWMRLARACTKHEDLPQGQKPVTPGPATKKRIRSMK